MGHYARDDCAQQRKLTNTESGKKSDAMASCNGNHAVNSRCAELQWFLYCFKGAISFDKDCVEDLRLYPTVSSQAVIDRAISLKAGQAELLYAYIDVEPVGFNRGYFTVDVRYFYRVTADAFVGAARPVSICGLAVFDKRAILFGSEGSAKVFSSNSRADDLDEQNLMSTNLPVAVVKITALK